MLSILELRKSLEKLQFRLSALPKESGAFDGLRGELATLAAKVIEAVELEFLAALKRSDRFAGPSAA